MPRKRHQTDGYGPRPVSCFALPPHHFLIRLSPADAEMLRRNYLTPLTAPDGQAVCRRHPDLRPNERGIVLR